MEFLENTSTNTNSLDDLYQELIIDHSRHPHNQGELPEPRVQLEGFNPLCGDRFTLYLDWDAERGVVRDIKFSGQGCAISTASTSIMTDLIKGKNTDEILHLADNFQKLLTSDESSEAVAKELGKAAVFTGVKAFPMRVKCATLSWHTLHKLMESLRTPLDLSNLEEQVWIQLRTCYDPEISVNIVDLGLIYAVTISDSTEDAGKKQVTITMTLTNPACTMGDFIIQEVKDKVNKIPGVQQTVVELVFDPPWSYERLSEQAKLEMGLL